MRDLFATHSRRSFLRDCAAGIGTLALADILQAEGRTAADDPLAPARGVMFAVPAGALVWCAIALGIWYFLR